MQMLYRHHNGKPEPQLLVSENFNEFDVAKFWVINGGWVLAERSSAKDGMIPMNTLFNVECYWRVFR